MMSARHGHDATTPFIRLLNYGVEFCESLELTSSIIRRMFLLSIGFLLAPFTLLVAAVLLPLLQNIHDLDMIFLAIIGSVGVVLFLSLFPIFLGLYAYYYLRNKAYLRIFKIVAEEFRKSHFIVNMESPLKLGDSWEEDFIRRISDALIDLRNKMDIYLDRHPNAWKNFVNISVEGSRRDRFFNIYIAPEVIYEDSKEARMLKEVLYQKGIVFVRRIKGTVDVDDVYEFIEAVEDVIKAKSIPLIYKPKILAAILVANQFMEEAIANKGPIILIKEGKTYEYSIIK